MYKNIASKTFDILVLGIILLKIPALKQKAETLIHEGQNWFQVRGAMQPHETMKRLKSTSKIAFIIIIK